MKKIIFMRHSYASGDFDGTDAKRPLTDKGREFAARAVKLLKGRNVSPNKIITSPKLRALQSAEILAKEFELPALKAKELDGSLTILEMWDFIKKKTAPGQTVIIVGHNPDLSELVTLLTNTAVALSPAEFAIINFEDDFTPMRLEPINEETFF